MTCLHELVSPDPKVSVRHQCELLELCRSRYYYQCRPETAENLALMRRLDELHLAHPVYGSRKLTVLLRLEGLGVNRKRVVRLLRLMGIEAIYAKPRTSQPEPGHQIYPYLLRDLEVTGPDQVWCSDITYVPMATGFMYLVAVMDWWSRYVLGWRLSNTLEAAFCVDAWEAALRVGRQAPLISNTDQGSQFTSPMFIDAVESAGVDVSMDGRGRWIDNRFTEPVDDLIVVEGFTGVWWLTQHGFTPVVGTMGSDCSERQSELIISLVNPDGRVWIVPDRDKAGERYAQMLLGAISPHRFVRWVKLADGGQPTDLSAAEMKNSFAL